MHNPQGDRAPEESGRDENRNESALRQERADLVRGVLARRSQDPESDTNLAEPIDVGEIHASYP